jgi:hypothetical protein
MTDRQDVIFVDRNRAWLELFHLIVHRQDDRIGQ